MEKRNSTSLRPILFLIRLLWVCRLPHRQGSISLKAPPLRILCPAVQSTTATPSSIGRALLSTRASGAPGASGASGASGACTMSFRRSSQPHLSIGGRLLTSGFTIGFGLSGTICVSAGVGSAALKRRFPTLPFSREAPIFPRERVPDGAPGMSPGNARP
jgi:hypothetical protein